MAVLKIAGCRSLVAVRLGTNVALFYQENLVRVQRKVLFTAVSTTSTFTLSITVYTRVTHKTVHISVRSN